MFSHRTTHNILVDLFLNNPLHLKVPLRSQVTNVANFMALRLGEEREEARMENPRK
jgi:hypothetical protein